MSQELENKRYKKYCRLTTIFSFPFFLLGMILYLVFTNPQRVEQGCNRILSLSFLDYCFLIVLFILLYLASLFLTYPLGALIQLAKLERNLSGFIFSILLTMLAYGFACFISIAELLIDEGLFHLFPCMLSASIFSAVMLFPALPKPLVKPHFEIKALYIS